MRRHSRPEASARIRREDRYRCARVEATVDRGAEDIELMDPEPPAQRVERRELGFDDSGVARPNQMRREHGRNVALQLPKLPLSFLGLRRPGGAISHPAAAYAGVTFANKTRPAEAEALTGLREKSALVREALRALIAREAARRLARLGGSEPDLAPIPRRRTKRR